MRRRWNLPALPGLAAILTLAGGGMAASAQEPTAWVGATLIDGTGAAPRVASLLVDEGKIVRIVDDPSDLPDGIARVDLTGLYVLPGLVDAHVHIGTFGAARRALRSGVTTARSMGTSFFADVGLRELAATGRIESPEIVAAGYHVRPRAAQGLFIDHPELGDLLDPGIHGEEAVRRVVRAMVSHGVNVIKTNATERAGLPETDPRQPLYSEAELRAIVEEATRAGIPVAAHAHGDGGARAAVLAGVRSIEHGTYLSEETLRAMVEHGTWLVPTLAVVVDLTQPGGDYDSPVLQVRGRHMLPRIRATARRAHELGIPIATGTDTGYGPNSVLRIGHELQELVGIGMTPAEAIAAATTVGAKLVGVDDHAGRLAVGYDADFIVMEQNPLEDIGAVQDLLMVVSNGRVILDRPRFQ